MTLESRKISIVQWILSLKDEKIIDKLTESVSAIQEENLGGKKVAFVSYQTISDRKFDLEEVKRQQNYMPFAAGELDQLIQEADIQEPIDVLLESID
ncbi:MAG: hypothetical protein AB8H12_15430 [Lewinella sp.]